MTQVFPEHLACAVTKARALTMIEKEAEFDIIYKEQPNLLGSVIVQQQMGNTLEQIEVLLNLLLVVHLSLREAGVQLPTVTEEAQERQLQRLVARVRFSEDLDRSLFDQSVQQMIDDHPEKYLYAYALNEITQAGFASIQKESAKYLMLAGLNLVNCLDEAK